jgi:hypothetical protein
LLSKVIEQQDEQFNFNILNESENQELMASSFLKGQNDSIILEQQLAD